MSFSPALYGLILEKPGTIYRSRHDKFAPEVLDARAQDLAALPQMPQWAVDEQAGMVSLRH